jgi:chromosome partitioning protein
MRVICLTNNKGGVSKTTSTVNLAYAFAEKGYKVLVVDVDPQCNSTYSLLGNLDQEHTLYDMLFEGVPLSQVIVPAKKLNLAVVPCSINLSAADLMLSSVHGRERKLARALEPVKANYDYIFVDTPPNLGLLTVNALIASTDVIIPISLTTYALIGISILEKTMQELRDNLDVKLPILGVFASMNDRTNINTDVFGAIKDHFGPLVFKTVIPRNIKIEEAHNQTTSLFDYAGSSTGAQAYKQLAEEVLQRAER